MYDGVAMRVDDAFPDRPFTVAQAKAAELPDHVLRQALRNHEVRRVLRGVYVHAAVEDSQLVRAQAAQLVVSRHSVLCDRTAAWFLGCEVFDYRELDVAPPLECYVLQGHDPTNRPECAGGTRDLLPVDWTEVGGVRVTTPLRTAADLACKLPRRQAVAAGDALMRRHGFTPADLVELLERRYRRRRGVCQARELAPITNPAAESQAESWVRVVMHDHGLPPPVLQHWVAVNGVPTYRLDLAYPHAKVAIEYNGEEFHSSPADREADRIRLEWLRAHSWTVFVLTKDDFTPEAIDRWTREIRTALGSR